MSGVVGNAGALVLLSKVTASAASTVDIENGFSAMYDDYIIEFDLSLSADDTLLNRWKFGGSYDAGTNYLYRSIEANLNITKTSYLVCSGGTTGTAVSGTLKLFAVNSASIKRATCLATGTDATPGLSVTQIGQSNTANITALRGVRFYANSGATLTGDIKLYGISKV